ncbi:hypothetical protein K8R20_02525 [bacterium]|nr:hypothetical protein [bacterium]
MTWTRAFLGRCSFKIEAIAKGERKMTILLIFTALTVVGYLVSLGIYLITKRKKLVPWMYKLNKASIVLVASVFVLTVFC